MKKMMLGLVVVMMLMSMVGCGDKNITNNNTVESEENSEMKEVINGITGEKETIEDNTEKTMTIFAEVIEILDGTTENVKRVRFESSIDGNVFTFSAEYPNDKFKMGDTVKFTVGVRNYGGPDLPDTNKIIAWEVVE